MYTYFGPNAWGPIKTDWEFVLGSLSVYSKGPVAPVVQLGEPLFATPCCNTSRATWPTTSEPSHKKPFFEVLSFSALFDPSCCCQLVCFEFCVLHFRLPLYTRNGQVGEHVLSYFFALVWLAAVVNLFVLNLLCLISVCLYPKRETGRL